MTPDVFMCGDHVGCVCTPLCEWPCWQRVGLTDQACCQDCQPLPPTDDELELPRPASALNQAETGHG